MSDRRSATRDNKVKLNSEKRSYLRMYRDVEGKSSSKGVHVFISYSTEDQSFVKRLARDLAKSGKIIWWDRKIQVGSSIVKEINSHIRVADYILLVLSPYSVESPWVELELSAGLMQEFQVGRSIVLPVLIANCKIPPLIADRRYADFRISYKNGLAELLQSIQSR